MLVYEKKVQEGEELKRHLFGTFGNIPSESDVQLTYKDETSTVITPVEGDSYVDGGSAESIQRIIRKSDDKFVNVFIGDVCIIGDGGQVEAAPVEVSAPTSIPKKHQKRVKEEAVEVSHESVPEEVQVATEE